jgi:hypothetical protein
LCLGLLLAFADVHAGGNSAKPQWPNADAVDVRMGVPVGPGLTLGGWATLQLQIPTRSVAAAEDTSPAPTQGESQFDDAQAALRARAALSDLSVMLWWDPAPGLKALAEVDSQYSLQIPSHSEESDGPAASPYLALERLYLEYRFDDALRLRAGKFLTPIGRWNQDHADPLTWTTMRPLLSQAAFPTHTTGLLASGNLGLGAHDVDYQLFVAGRQNWRTDPTEGRFQHALGLRVAASWGADLQLGVSAAAYRQQELGDDDNRVVGADFAWSRAGVEVDAEAIARRGDKAGDTSDRGWFVQAVFSVAPRWFLTSRFEAYKRRHDAVPTQSALVGLAYRSGRFWVFKAEWVQPNGRPAGVPHGILASLTLLF